MKIKGLIFAVALLAVSCTKQNLETTFINQDKKIDDYIQKTVSSKSKTVTVCDDDGVPLKKKHEPEVDSTIVVGPRVETRGGCHRIVLEEGQGKELKTNGETEIEYAGYVFNSSPSMLFATNIEEVAKAKNWTEVDTDLLCVSPADKNLVKGLRNALVGVREGEHCIVLFSGKYGFGKRPLGVIPANSALCYEIVVHSVNNK